MQELPWPQTATTNFSHGVVSRRSERKHKAQSARATVLSLGCKCILLNLCSETIHGALSSFLSLLKEKPQ